MAVINFVIILLEVVLLFNLLIFVHELGHFLAARWRGLKVERFAIWFGKPLWIKKINGVEYVLGCIPAGGYVSLPQMATMEAIEGKSDAASGEPSEPLPEVSALDKIIVAFAGPLFSFLLALAFAVVVMVVGRPVSEAETTTFIGYVEKDGPAGKAGLLPGDQVLEVDGKPVSKFGGMGDSITWRIVRSEGETVRLKIRRGTQEMELEAAPAKDPTKLWQRKSLRQIKILPAQSAIVAEVVTNSPAAVVGLKKGDRILAINGQRLHHFLGIGEYVEAHPGEALALTVQRNGSESVVRVLPEKPVLPANESPKLGIRYDGNGETRLAYPGAIEQVRASVVVMIDTFGALLARNSDIKPQHLGGAVKIMDVYYRLFDSEQGWRLAIWFSVLMNVNLALLNLLPIPVLDGGHIVLAIIEGIRRKPISARIIGAVQTGCAVLLIGFMLYLAFYDLQELPWNRSKATRPEIQFSPKPAPGN